MVFSRQWIDISGEKSHVWMVAGGTLKLETHKNTFICSIESAQSCPFACKLLEIQAVALGRCVISSCHLENRYWGRWRVSGRHSDTLITLCSDYPIKFGPTKWYPIPWSSCGYIQIPQLLGLLCSAQSVERVCFM